MLLNVAIDTGYGYALGKSSFKEVRVNNYISEVEMQKDVKEMSASITRLDENNIMIKYEGTYYTVGEYTCKSFPTTTRKITSNRIGDQNHLIELLSCLGLLCKEKEYDVNLMVGLPVKLADKYQEFINWLKRDFEFSFLTKDGEVNKIVHVKDVDCMLQPLAPIFTLNPLLLSKKIISIDVGHGTSDVIFLNDKSIVREAGARLQAEGMQFCYKWMEDLIIDKYQDTPYAIRDLNEKQVEEAIEKGQFKVSDEYLDIESLLKTTLRKYSDYLFHDNIEKKYSKYLSLADIVLVNGGVFDNDYFRNMLEEKFTDSRNIKFKIHHKPQWAIVYGMFIYMNKFKSSFRNKDEYFNRMNIEDLYISN